ncbi:hypothetical protein Tco_0769706 [Tanacetum coccineum]|uniref:C2H2-type domain-containing protein n=1 Tax=Tanacetum coccineum TaxID=301880 RepID=A0ABQ4ZDG0_9ASTR
MLKSFDREDLETLWKLVKAKHGSTRPEKGYERVLWGDLRIMFEHHVEDTVWRNLQGNKVLIWKLFDSYGVYFVRFQYMHIFMLVEKKYPLTPATITDMLNKKLQADHLNEIFAKTFDWDEEEVFDEEEVTQVKVLMALADDEITIGKSHARNEQLKEEKKINEKYLTSSKKVSQYISEQIPHQKKKVLGGELLTESSSKRNENENLFVPAFMVYDQEMVPKTKDWVESLNPDSKLQNFNTRRILVPESQAVNESLKTSNTPLSSKDSEAEFLTPLPPLKILQGALLSSEVMPLTFQPHYPKERACLGIMKYTKPETQDSPNESVSGTVTINESKQTTPLIPTEVKDTEQEILYCMICKMEDHRYSDHEMYIALLKRSENYKAQSYQYASSSKQIMRAKAKPFPQCTHCGFNDHIPNDYRNYPEYEICRSYDHSTSGHDRVIQIRGGVLAESSQSNKSLYGVKCNTCGSTVHSTSDHNEFDHFKRETHQGAYLVLGQWMLKE